MALPGQADTKATGAETRDPQIKGFTLDFQVNTSDQAALEAVNGVLTLNGFVVLAGVENGPFRLTLSKGVPLNP